jgi:ABC-type uncharacterized transport system auxiliary subunit
MRLAIVFVAGTALLLSGCGLLGGGGPKPQMYRFGAEDPAAAARTSATIIQLNGINFQRAAQGDRLLAVRGAEVFYLAKSRWVSPAEDLFAQAADRAFDRAGLDLIRRGQPQSAVANLNLTVPVFEVRYTAGLEAAPTVVVEVEAALASTTGERGALGGTRAVASVPAAANSLNAIVAAYDTATRQALDQIAVWAGATARAAPRP